jgi:hypothetical protein
LFPQYGLYCQTEKDILYSSFFHIPVTLVCVARIITGVPFGAQTAWLSNNKTGIPLEVTLVAAVTHWAVMQGLGAPEILNGHPATINGAGRVTMGCPLTITRGFVTVGWACPACAHCTVAPRCSKKPGINNYYFI